MAKITIKLDRDREIKFPFVALTALDEECKINLHSPETYTDFSPRKIRDLVWAGQLHTEKPLTRFTVSNYLPTDLDACGEIAIELSKAIRVALGIKAVEEPKDDAG